AFTVVITPSLAYAGQPAAGGSVKFRVDGVVQGTAQVVNGVARLSVPPKALLFKPGLHTVTASYTGDANFASGSTALQHGAPKLPTLRATVAGGPGNYVVRILNNGKLLTTLGLSPAVTAAPVILFPDFDLDGVQDLVIRYVVGGQTKRIAFSGVTAQRLS